MGNDARSILASNLSASPAQRLQVAFMDWVDDLAVRTLGLVLGAA